MLLVRDEMTANKNQKLTLPSQGTLEGLLLGTQIEIGGGRGVHLVKEGGDALIQTGKKQRTSDGVRLRLDLETPQGPVCWLTCL